MSASASRFSYRPVQGWGRLPDGMAFGDIGGIAVDSRDRIYVFSRSEHPMVVFDTQGKLLDSWGQGVFTKPHGLHIGPDDTLYCTDDGDHTVRRFTTDGRLLMQIGTTGQGSGFMSGRPLNRPTHTALSPTGDLYVSDGYGNARIHKFAPDGTLLLSWGEPGTGPGEFNIPHNVVCDADGWVYVADRENHRIQIFDPDGRYEAQWNNLHRPMALHLQPGPEPLFYVGEAPSTLNANRDWPGIGARVSILDRRGTLVGRYGGLRAGIGEHEFIAPHAIGMDSRGHLYVGEVARAGWPQSFPGTPMPADLRMIRKLVPA